MKKRFHPRKRVKFRYKSLGKASKRRVLNFSKFKIKTPQIRSRRKFRVPFKIKASKIRTKGKFRIPKIASIFSPKRILKKFFKFLFSKRGFKFVLITSLLFLGITFGLFAWFAKDLPTPNKINARMIAETTKIFARDGTLLYEIHGDKNRTLISYEEMPKYVKDATVVIEDKNFWVHKGFSARGIARALIGLVSHDPSKGGGSTITQQLVKNAILTPERTFTRKIKEIILSIEIEQIYKKEDILKMYLNEIPYGSDAYGVQVAAKTYFGKDAKDLDLAESAALAALPAAPTYYSPYGQHKDELLTRKDRILDLMTEQKYITKEQAESAKKKELVFVDRGEYANITAPHFVMYVREKLVEMYGEKMATEGGLKVYTTLDLGKQKIAEEAIAQYADKNLANYNASNAALISMDPKTGQVLAMVGSKDYNNKEIDGYVNVAVAERQPGSSFKPFAYATAWKKNWGPGSTLYDFKTDFGNGYIPSNYDGYDHGVQSMRTALSGSLNIPAVKTLYLAGINETINTAHELGITTLNEPDRYGLALVLGGGEVKLLDMAAGFSVFADMGISHPATWFTKIEDSKGKVLDEYREGDKKQVLDPQIAYLMSDVLSDNSARSFIFGSQNSLTLPDRKVAAKTGTTNEWRDAWTLGYTPTLVTGVWAGNNDNTPMSAHADGSYVAAPIWNYYMRNALSGINEEWYERPEGIKTETIDAITGKKVTPATKQTRSDIFPSWYKPETVAGETKEIKICKLSHHLATEKCPLETVENIYFGQVNAEIPPSDPAFSRWQAPVAAWAAGQGYSSGVANIPTKYCDIHTGEGLPGITIISPGNGDTVNSPVTVKANVIAPHGINSVTIYVDNNEYQASGSGNNYEASISITSGSSHQIKAKVVDSIFYSAVSEIINIDVVLLSLNLTYNSGSKVLTATVSGGDVDSVKFYGVKPEGDIDYLGIDSIPSSGNKYNYTLLDPSPYNKAYAIASPGDIKSNDYTFGSGDIGGGIGGGGFLPSPLPEPTIIPPQDPKIPKLK